MTKEYEPFLICDDCVSVVPVTKHHLWRRTLIHLGKGEGRVADHYRLYYRCNRCGMERVWGREQALPKYARLRGGGNQGLEPGPAPPPGDSLSAESIAYESSGLNHPD